jgi:Fe2+ transport system protein FeoA
MECAACLKNSLHIFVEKIYKMGFLEGSSVPVLYVRTHGS